jgi:hypothetical protein
MSLDANYTPKQFNLSGLKGISDKTLEMHLQTLRRIRQRDEPNSPPGLRSSCKTVGWIRRRCRRIPN